MYGNISGGISHMALCLVERRPEAESSPIGIFSKDSGQPCPRNFEGLGRPTWDTSATQGTRERSEGGRHRLHPPGHVVCLRSQPLRLPPRAVPVSFACSLVAHQWRRCGQRPKARARGDARWRVEGGGGTGESPSLVLDN
jgi:hypothetical protein